MGIFPDSKREICEGPEKPENRKDDTYSLLKHSTDADVYCGPGCGFGEIPVWLSVDDCVLPDYPGDQRPLPVFLA